MARKRALIRRPESVSRPLPDYMVDILGRRYPVTDMVQASVRVEAFRDQTGMRASQMGSRFLIFDKTNTVIGYVTYNGRVWAGKPEDALSNQVHLVYDPSEPAHRAAYSAPTAITPSRVVRNNPRDPYRPCGAHEEIAECKAAPSACRWGGCDAIGHSYDEPSCKTQPRYYADTKSFFCDEGRRKFLKDYHWDDDKGWVDKHGQQG